LWHPNSGIMTVLFLTMLVFLTFPACGMPSSADTQIHIAGINPPSAYPNETVHPYGNGATPNSTVTAMLSGLTNQIYTINATNPWIIMPGGNLTLGSNCSSLIGDWQVDFVTPFVYPACYSVVIFDNSSLTNDSVSLCVLMKAVIGETLPGLNFTYGPGNLIILTPNLTGGPLSFYLPASATPSSGPAGMFVTLHGRFASGGQITVYFENSQVATITDQPAGNWSVSFQVPSVPPGKLHDQSHRRGWKVDERGSIRCHCTDNPSSCYYNFLPHAGSRPNGSRSVGQHDHAHVHRCFP